MTLRCNTLTMELESNFANQTQAEPNPPSSLIVFVSTNTFFPSPTSIQPLSRSRLSITNLDSALFDILLPVFIAIKFHLNFTYLAVESVKIISIEFSLMIAEPF